MGVKFFKWFLFSLCSPVFIPFRCRRGNKEPRNINLFIRNNRACLLGRRGNIRTNHHALRGNPIREMSMLHSQRNATTFTVFGIEFRNFVYNTNRAEKAHPCDALRECIHALPVVVVVVGIEGTRSILVTGRRSGILGCVRWRRIGKIIAIIVSEQIEFNARAQPNTEPTENGKNQGGRTGGRQRRHRSCRTELPAGTKQADQTKHGEII